jgi:outer membrane protein TolC
MRTAFCLTLLALGGCSAAWWARSAEEEAAEVLAEKGADFERFRETGLVRPDAAAVREPAMDDADLADVPRAMGLAEALAVATGRNRGYLSEKESLTLSALALTNARNRFSPFFTGTVSALLSDTRQAVHSNVNAGSLGVSQILPTGGTVSATGTAAARNAQGERDGYRLDSGFTVDLKQPLLRDAGYETSHEELTQAERNVVYAIRDFELFREDFTIDVTTRFYGLVRQQQEIRNASENLKSREFQANQAASKAQVNLGSEVEKLRAEREFLQAQSEMLSIEEGYKLSLDRFKIQLGLPTDFPLEIRYEEPAFRAVPIDLDSAVDAALHNRVDLATLRDRLEDAERNLRIRVNQLLPDLDLEAAYARTAPPDSRFGRQNWEDWRYAVGLTLSLPLERTAERNALKQAMIELDRARRALTLGEDGAVLEVRETLRQIRRTEATLEIRRREIEAAEREKLAAEYRYELGEVDIRYVSDATNAVTRAKNSYIQELIEYELARIQAFRDIGILFIGPDGKWVEP